MMPASFFHNHNLFYNFLRYPHTIVVQCCLKKRDAVPYNYKGDYSNVDRNRQTDFVRFSAMEN